MIIGFLLFVYCSPSQRDIREIHNPEIGLWQRTGTYEVVLKRVFTIGEVSKEPQGMGRRSSKGEMGPYEFYLPEDVKVGSNGDIYVLDSGNHRIQVFDKNGRFIRSIGRFGQGPGEFNRPEALALDLEDNIYVADTRNGRIQIFDRKGRRLHSFWCKFGAPCELIVDSHKNIYTYLRGDQVLVRKYNFWGKPLKAFGELLNDKKIIGWDLGGNFFSKVCFAIDKDTLYVCYKGIYRIDKYAPDGQLLLTFNRESPELNKLLNEYRKRNLSGQKAKTYAFMIHDIAFSAKDRLIWVTALDDIDIFNSQGIFLFNLSKEAVWDLAFSSTGEVYTVDPLFQMVLNKYKYLIKKKGGRHVER